jgi:hypothetical protein
MSGANFLFSLFNILRLAEIMNAKPTCPAIASCATAECQHATCLAEVLMKAERFLLRQGYGGTSRPDKRLLVLSLLVPP